MNSGCLCGSYKSIKRFKARDLLMGEPGEFTIMQCKECNLIFTSPRPDRNVMQKYYPNEYWDSNVPSTEKSYIRKAIVKIMDAIFNPYYIPNFSHGANILEVGTGTGSFLAKLKDKGLHLFGVEVAGNPVTFAKKYYGLNIFCGRLENANYNSKFFDAIFSWMVFEHLDNLNTTLNEIHRILKVNGFLIFSIPNAGSWEFRLFRKYWYALQVPTHLWHFSTDAILPLIKSNGFKIEKIIFHKNLADLVGSIGYILRNILGENVLSDMLVEYPKNLSMRIRILLIPLEFAASLFKISSRITIVAKIE